MKIGISSDHRGFDLKNKLVEYFSDKKDKLEDMGCYTGGSCDYSSYALKLGKEVANNKLNFGVLICGTGIGMSIAANKVKGVYCARILDKSEAEIARRHNDANVMAIPATTRFEDAKDMIETFVNTDFSGEERHARRINKIKDFEEQNER